MAVLWCVLGLLVLFLIVIFIRAATFTPPAEEPATAKPIEIDEAAAADHLAQMVRMKTVSSRDKTKEDEGEFEAFRALLPKLYPNVAKTCPRERIGRTGLLYHWKGRESGAPSVLMAHYDVVSVTGQSWEKPPFCGEIDENGVLWGRGTLDTKGTLCGILEGAEALIKKGFTPRRDVYFAFSGDEEIMGESAPAIVEELSRRGIKPALVLDEGGAIVEKVFPGVQKKSAVVGIAEKGQMDVEFSVKGKGGHASAPPVKTPVTTLAKAISRVYSHPFPARLTPAASQMFDTLGRHSTFAYKLIFANLWCFLPLLKLICKKAGGELNALMRTTCAFTTMQGSSGANVLPVEAKVNANLRLCRGDSCESAVAYLRKTVNDPDVELHMVQGTDASPYAATDTEGWEKVKRSIKEVWPEALVSPYLMVACSDSRHYCRICDTVLRFSAMELSKEERGYIHAANERVPVEKVGKAARFFAAVLQKC